jgi:hypothetical protein
VGGKCCDIRNRRIKSKMLAQKYFYIGFLISKEEGRQGIALEKFWPGVSANLESLNCTFKSRSALFEAKRLYATFKRFGSIVGGKLSIESIIIPLGVSRRHLLLIASYCSTESQQDLFIEKVVKHSLSCAELKLELTSAINLDEKCVRLTNKAVDKKTKQGDYNALCTHIKNLELQLLNLRSSKPKVSLEEGPHAYGYLCNDVLKAGDSLINDDGSHRRTNNHATSVPRLQYGYIIYMEKAHIISFRALFRAKFNREQYNRDHFLCTVQEAENFIIEYCKLMGWGYKCVSKADLERYNNSL